MLLRTLIQGITLSDSVYYILSRCKYIKHFKFDITYIQLRIGKMSCGVYLRVESDDDHVFDVPGMHQFHIKNGGNVLDLLVAAHRANSR